MENGMGTVTGSLPPDNVLFILKFLFIICIYCYVACLFLGRRPEKRARRDDMKDAASSLFHLTIHSGAEALEVPGNHVYHITRKITVGRDEGNDIQLHDATASGTHCVIYMEDAMAVLEDLQSKNGTMVNGKKIEGKHELKTGDIIEIGMVAFILRGAS